MSLESVQLTTAIHNRLVDKFKLPVMEFSSADLKAAQAVAQHVANGILESGHSDDERQLLLNCADEQAELGFLVSRTVRRMKIVGVENPLSKSGFGKVSEADVTCLYVKKFTNNLLKKQSKADIGDDTAFCTASGETITAEALLKQVQESALAEGRMHAR